MAHPSLARAVQRALLALLCAFCWSAKSGLVAQVADASQKAYDIPADTADRSLKRLAEQSGREVLFPSDAVAGVRTRSVRGQMTAAEALRQMLTGTALQGIEDPRTGAFTVRRETSILESEKNVGSRRVTDAAAGMGLISGRVSNQATGAYLPGAAVYVDGTSITAVTDSEGAYLIQVPAGRHVINISYTGLNPQQRSVEVMAGTRAAQDFDLTAEIYELAKFVVAGEREGNAAAIMQQRTAPNVKNVISTDAFGSLAGNPADLLERVTGITVDRTGGDVRAIMVRGITEDLNSVTMDGARIANINADRGFQYQNIGSDHIETIEVIKAPTPDMDGDAIGGTVNFKTRSAFNLKGRRMSYSIGGIRARERDYVHPSFTFSYSNSFSVLGGERNLGVSLGVGWRQHNAVIQRTTQTFNNAQGYLFNLNVGYDFANTRTRYGGGLKIDYKLSEDTALFVNFTAAPHRENNQVKTMVVAGNQVVATLNAQGQPTGTGSIMPGFSTTFTEIRPVAASTINLSQNAHLHRLASSFTSQFGGRTRKAGYELDYDATYSYAENKPFSENAAAQLAGIGFTFEKESPSSFTPKLTFTGGPDAFNLNNYTFTNLARTDSKTANEMLGAQLNYRKFFELAVPTDIKVGLKYRELRMERWNWSTQWTSPGLSLGQFEDQAFNYAPFDGHYANRPFLSVDAMVDDLEKNPNTWIENPTLRTQNGLTGRQSLNEKVSSAYIQGTTKIDRLQILGGVRVEKTDVSGKGSLQQVTAEERARRAAWVGTVTPDEARRRIIAEFGQRRTDGSDYLDVLPSIHFNYNFSRAMIARLSYSSGIGRPPPGNLMPLDLVDDVAQSVRINNTNLKAQRGQNFDASLEYYFEPAGLVSAGVFYKEINDFIFSTIGQFIGAGQDNGFDGQYVGYSLSSRANGGYAKIKGLELSYQQQFTFLPGWMSGFGAFANYTRLETEGDYGTIGNVRDTESLTGFVPEAANVGVSYIKGKISLRVQYGFNSERLLAFNADPLLRRWELSTNRIDIKTKYFYHQHFSLYADVYNISGDNQRERFGSGAVRFLQDRYDPQFHFGIEGRF